MQFKPRFLTLALGLALAPLSSIAQDIRLLGESSVTFVLNFSTSVTTRVGSGVSRIDTTKSYNSALPQADLIRGLLGLTADANVSSWRLAAVRPLAADLFEVDTTFALYLVNDSLNIRQAVPLEKFYIRRDATVVSSVVTHSTRNIITGSGTVTNNTEMFFIPGFVRKDEPAVITGPLQDESYTPPRTYNLSTKIESVFTLDSLFTTGFSAVQFNTRFTEPVFSFGLGTVRYTGRGDFTGTFVNTRKPTRKYTSRNIPDFAEPATTDTVPTPAFGLAYVTVNLLPAKLVEHSLYPDVSF